MPTTIKLKNSVTTTSVPSSLVQGEVAINVTDKKVWVGNAATTPIQLLGGGADGNFTNISVSSVATFGAGTVSAPSITTTGDTNTGIFFPAADTIAFTEGGVESMRIDSSGNVGIGISSPTNRFHVADNSSSAMIYGLQSGAGDIIALASGASEKFRITNDGNVGIGTSSPGGRLQLTVPAATENTLRMTGSTTAACFTQYANTAGSFYVGLDNSAGTSFGAAYSGNIYHGGAYPILFWTSGTERMRITSSGSVNIGSTSGNGVFNVTGGGNGTYLTQTTGAGYVLQTDAQSNAGTYYFVNFLKAGVGISNITSNGTTITYGTGSDYRLKENIKPMTGGLNKVMQLKPSTWNWQSFFGEGSSQGFVAHELQEIVPEAVTGKKDDVDEDGKPRYQNVDTSFIVATLTAAIQEQQALIENLTTRLNALEGK